MSEVKVLDKLEIDGKTFYLCASGSTIVFLARPDQLKFLDPKH